MCQLCVNCNQPIEKINYVLGAKWMHIDQDASFPSQQKGSAWVYCKLSVAAPKNDKDS